MVQCENFKQLREPDNCSRLSVRDFSSEAAVECLVKGAFKCLLCGLV